MTPREHSIRIAREAAEEHGVPWRDITAHSRFAHIVEARKAAVRRVAEAEPDLSPAEIGKLFQRDRTTILNTLGRIEKRRP